VARVTIDLDGFAQERLEHEAQSQAVTLEQLVRHALMYYLADLDSGRVATRVPADESAAASQQRSETG